MNKSKQVKFQYQNDIKRSFLPSSYDELLKNLFACFKIDLRAQEAIVISYRDDENDKVRISHQFDLDQAIIFYETQGLANLKLFVEIDQEPKHFNEDFSKIEVNDNNTNIESNVDQEKKEEAPKEEKTIEEVKRNPEEEDKFALNKEEISIILTEVVDKEIASMKEKIVAKLKKKADKIIRKKCGGKKEKKEKKEKKKDKEENKVQAPVHYRVECDGCGLAPITGIRYKCSICDNFDYCEECEEKYKEFHPHPFLKIRNCDFAPIEIFCNVKNTQVNDRWKYVTSQNRPCGGNPFRKVGNFFKDIFGSVKDSFFKLNCQQGKNETCEKIKTNKVPEKEPEISPVPLEYVKPPVVDINIEAIKSSFIEQVKKPEEYKKVGDPVIFPKLEEFPQQNKLDDNMKKDIYVSIMKELRQNYDLSMFSNAQILDAIERADGNADDVFNYLFSS